MLFSPSSVGEGYPHMAAVSSTDRLAQPPGPSSPRTRLAFNWDWVGLLPFFAFIAAFLLFPALSIVIRSFVTDDGTFTFAYIQRLSEPIIFNTYRTTALVSLVTAIVGGLMGFLLAASITIGGLPKWVRSSVLSFCGVAANFAGVPLVFAFTALLGNRGILNLILEPTGLRVDRDVVLYSFFGLCLVYTYFQIPLMVLITVPAIEGLRKEWREAAENLGATTAQYWRMVALPILSPSIFGALALLFANAYSTHATAVALLGAMGSTQIVSVLVGNQFRTDTFGDPGLGYALAFGMIVVIAITVAVYTYSRRRAAQWTSR
jgi:putative spermidine/putrescine transport system permease protein